MLRSDCVNSVEHRRGQRNSWNQKKRFEREMILRLACKHTQRMSPASPLETIPSDGTQERANQCIGCLVYYLDSFKGARSQNSDFTHEALEVLFLPRSTRDYPRLP